MNRKAVIKSLKKRLEEMNETYGAKEIPPHVQKRIDNILNAPKTATDSELIALIERAYQVHEVYLLAAWGNGKIPGRVTPEKLEGQAKNAENLSKMFERQDNPKASAKQIAKAAELRKQADALRIKV